MTFQNTQAPRIPSAPKEYDAVFFNRFARSLDTYFAILDSKAGINVDSLSTGQLVTPFVELVVTSGVKANPNKPIPPSTALRITATGNFDLTGFITDNAVYNSSSVLTLAALNGQQLIVLNNTGYNMSIYNNDATCLIAARILTGTGTTINMSNGVVSFIYSSADAKWAVISHQG